MRFLVLTSLTLTYLCISISAQEPELKTLPLIQKINSTPSTSENNLDDGDFEKLKRIYDKLVDARGDFRYPVPKLCLRKEESRMASTNYAKMEIVIEQKAYKICQQFGDAAIAYLLAHELTHYYEKHAWKNSFVAAYSDLKIGKDLNKIQDQVFHETQADYLGGFLAFSAGFDVFERNDEIIKKLYKAYNIEDDNEGYPSLQDRIELAKRSTKKLQSLTEVFEMANLLSAIRKYSEAYLYYQYILMQFQSREIYNNLGVTLILNALQYFSQSALKFSYVVELDLETQGSRDVRSKIIRDSLLQQAIRHLDAAIGLDPNYAPAYLNKSTALALLGDTIRAEFYTKQEALKIAQNNNFKKTAIDATILLGILKARAGDTATAEKYLQTAIDSGSKLAQLNLNILHNIRTDHPVVNKNLLTDHVSIENYNLETFSDSAFYSDDKVITINSKYAFLQFNEDSLSFKIYININIDNRNTNYFILTKPNCTAMTDKQTCIGSSRSEVETNHGQPLQTIETPQGNIMVYDNLFFIIGNKNKVVKWGSFLSKKWLN